MPSLPQAVSTIFFSITLATHRFGILSLPEDSHLRQSTLPYLRLKTRQHEIDYFHRHLGYFSVGFLLWRLRSRIHVVKDENEDIIVSLRSLINTQAFSLIVR